MSDYVNVLASARQLPVNEQLQLIEDLWDTVPEAAMPPLSPEWMAEIQRRSAEIDAGTVKGVPWEEVFAAALRRAGVEVPDDAH